MGTVCSCLQDTPMSQDVVVNPEATRPMVSKSELDHIYNQNKFNMINELAALYEQVINGETIRRIKITDKSLGANGASLLANLFSYTTKVD